MSICCVDTLHPLLISADDFCIANWHLQQSDEQYTLQESNGELYDGPHHHCCLSYDSARDMEELLRRDRLLDPVRLATLDLAMQEHAAGSNHHSQECLDKIGSDFYRVCGYVSYAKSCTCFYCAVSASCESSGIRKKRCQEESRLTD